MCDTHESIINPGAMTLKVTAVNFKPVIIEGTVSWDGGQEAPIEQWFTA
jgi:hypothetical protein